MFVPSYDSILKAIGTSRAALSSTKTVTIPVDLFKFLLQTTMVSSEFNEEGYLAANPDVADAVQKGAVESPRLHYIGYGYFEGRTGAMPKVDERWYLTNYPDVAAAVKAGDVSSGAEHFEIIGASEGRSPNAHHDVAAMQWKKALVGPG